MKIISILMHLFLVIFLTLITQIGGIIWCISLLLKPKISKSGGSKIQVAAFVVLYILSTYIIIPPLAFQFGRTPLPVSKNSNLAPHTYMTVILNRHYVTPTLKSELNGIARHFEQAYPNIKTIYLDANFPFWDGFPLLPHLSHNDGKKVDLSFLYSKNEVLVNDKPSNSGYGHYEPPKNNESNQPNKCISSGYWQYDFPKYLTMGSSQGLIFNADKTKDLLNIILNRKKTQKVFIEPHLKDRMNITHNKLRFHGCRSVRHDDHIHYQIR